MSSPDPRQRLSINYKSFKDTPYQLYLTDNGNFTLKVKTVMLMSHFFLLPIVQLKRLSNFVNLTSESV
jgi:hypothetical protein